MNRPLRHARPFLLGRLAIAAAGLAVLTAGWRLAAADPPAPADAAQADAIPLDYVPQRPAPDPTAGPDPLLDLQPAPIRAPFGPPLGILRVTSGFGLRRHPLLGFTRMHQGVDFAAPRGAPVLAAADGIVTQAGRDGGYGNLLRLRHGGGWETGYAHLMAFAPGVAAGVRVARGEVIGFVGDSGLATGPHLHYEVSLDGVKLDPMSTPFGDAAMLPQTAPAPFWLRPMEQTDDPPPQA